MKNSVVLYNVSAMFNRLFSTVTPIKYILTLVALLCISNYMWGAWTGSGEAVKYENSTYYVYYDMSEKSKKAGGLIAVYFDAITLNGPGSKVEFEAKKANLGSGNLVLRVNNGSWGDVWSNGLKTSYNSYSQSIDNNVTQIQFYMPTGSLKKTYQSLKVTMAQYIENPSQTSFEFGEGKVGDTNSTGTFTIPWCNVPSMTYTLSGTGADCLSVSVANNSDAGKYNTATFTITYDRTKASNLNATLTVTNSYGNYSKTITITGSTSKYDQTLSWNNESAIETNMQLGKTQTVTATATSGLAVTYSSSDNNILTVDASGKITAVGIGSATITASQAGNYKYNAATPSITKTYTVWNKNTPIFTPNGFNEANVCHLKVGDKVTLEVLNVSDGLSGDFKVKTDNNILGITRNGNIITIEALNAGTADATFTQTENNDIFGAEKKYQFSVSKINNTLAIASASYTKYVDDEITNIISSVNSNATVTTSSSDATIAYYDVTSNKILIPNSEAKSFSSKTITITIAQAETYKYTAAEKTITLTINKYTPDFTWNTGNAMYYYLSSIPNIFDTSNDDFGYSVVSDNENVAKVIDNTLHIYNVKETTNITVTQAENYKWNGKTETYTITPENPNNHVTFEMNDDNHTVFEKSLSDQARWKNNGYQLGDGGWTSRTDEVVIAFTGIPDTLYFDKILEESVGQLPGTYLCRVYESADGVVWNGVWEREVREEKYSGAVHLSSTTRFVKFYYYGTVFCNFRNITVSELEKFEATPNPLDFGTQGVKYGEQVLPLNFSHANAGRITIDTIIGNDAKYFTVTPTVIPGTGRDMSGTAHLNVAFDNKGEDRGLNPYKATLVITDNAGNTEEVALTGIRHGKSTPVFTWNPNHLPYYFGSSIANIVVSSNTDYTKCPFTITSSNENIAKVENGRLYIYETDGEVTFTVTQQGNDDYNEHTEKFTFTPSKRPELTVPFRATEELYKKAAVSVYWSNWDGANNEIRLGEDCNIFQEGAWDWEKKTVLFVFDGVPDKVSFQYRASNGTATAAQWNVEQSADGVNWESIWSKESSSTSWNTIEKELLPNTRYLRFSYSGNFAGYYKNIAVSELVGYKYLRAADGQYLSRGAKWGTQAVVDAFGVVARISRYTQDNENIYTRFFFVDNEQYMFETETKDDQRLHEIFTDNGTALNTNHLWQINNDGGILTIQSANEVGEVSHKGDYITTANGVLAFTSNEAEATQWQMEDYTEHPQYITDMLNRQAAEAAAKDFGTDINTLEKVRNRLKEEDFEILNINILELALGEQTGEGRTLEGMPQIYEQTITGLDTGFYRLTVKALYRISNSEIAWKCYQEKGKESVLAYAYANNVKYPIQSVYASYHSSAIENTDEQHDGKYYSTTLTSAEVAFNDANRYLNDVYVYVAPDPGETTGTLRYGIKDPSYVPGAWLAYENITLTHFKRKEFIFEGKDDINTTTPTQWTEQYNWNRDAEPNKYHVAIIQANVIIDTEVSVHSMIIDTTFNPDVIVTIAPNGGLTVGAGGVKGATTDNFIIKADNTEGATKGQTGYIRISPYTEQAMPYATMEMYSKAYFDMTADDRNNVGSWQYVGSPMAEAGTLARSIYKSSWIYNWNEATAEWENNRKTLKLQPFEGYCTSQYKYPEGMLLTNIGQLASNGNVELNLTYTGDADTLRCNVFANSYAAPIDITKFKASDFSEGVEATINLFNTGSKKNIANQIGKTDLDAPGQYIAIPVETAAELVTNHNYPAVIPAMQGFFVNTTKAGTLTLNYEQLVWNADYTQHANAPLRTKERSTTTGALCVSIEADGWRDNLYLLEAEKYDANYQNGYDARKMMNGELNIFAVEEEDTYLAVDATHSLVNTRVGVRTGEETAYTFTFANLRTQEPIALMDNETEQIIPIAEGTTYTFFTTPNTMITDRFVIIANEDGNAGVATNIQNTTIEKKIHKFIKDNKLFILKDGILYNAQGQLVSK